MIENFKIFRIQEIFLIESLSTTYSEYNEYNSKTVYKSYINEIYVILVTIYYELKTVFDRKIEEQLFHISTAL